MSKSRLKLLLVCNQSNQAGFTIIESLMAIVVAGILLSAIAPAIILSVGNRVQSKRVEAAIQAARSYIDGVNTGAITAPTQTIQNTTTSNTKLLYNVPAPTSISGLYCVNRDNTAGCQTASANDLVVQSFRTENAGVNSYTMALRVYRADAFRDSGALKANGIPVGGRVTQGTVNGGLGDRKAPLVEMTTEINPSASQPSFSDYCARLKNSVGTNNNSQCN